MPGLVTSASATPAAVTSTPWPQAPVVVGPTTKSATRPTNILPSYLRDDASKTIREDFDASKHLNFQHPKNIVKMKDIGLEGQGISPNAVSDPFPLFTQEAVEQIRAEVFSDEVLEECQFASAFCRNMIRGMGPARAPFTYSAWNSPELIEAVSKVAGVDLVPSIDYEIANINVSAKSDSEPINQDKPVIDDALSSDELPAFAWHYDSFPFVCVVMLSDCSDMVGGETALRTPNGEVKKVRGPAMGTAVVMQGRYIEHQALKALGGKERISMVTCFRPRSPLVPDETVLTGVRGISHKSELYSQYTEYRLEILEDRLRAKMREEKRRQVAKRDFNTQGMRGWLIEQKAFLEAMLYELTDE
jgi:hypothetical protein